MQLSWSWGRMGQRGSTDAHWCWGSPVSTDKILGAVVVVHVEQQADDIQDIYMEEDHDHNEISPGADITSLDMQSSGAIWEIVGGR